MAKDTDKEQELNPRLELQRMERKARTAELERRFARAQTAAIRGDVPPARKGFERFVVGEECYTADGKRHLRGEVISVRKGTKSTTWCPFDKHVSQQKGDR
jgi:hypothetical protein